MESADSTPLLIHLFSGHFTHPSSWENKTKCIFYCKLLYSAGCKRLEGLPRGNKLTSNFFSSFNSKSQGLSFSISFYLRLFIMLRLLLHTLLLSDKCVLKGDRHHMYSWYWKETPKPALHMFRKSPLQTKILMSYWTVWWGSFWYRAMQIGISLLNVIKASTKSIKASKRSDIWLSVH